MATPGSGLLDPRRTGESYRTSVSSRSDWMTPPGRNSGPAASSTLTESLITCGRRSREISHPQSALDFGCGIGRLLFPLSKVSQRAIGVDISPTMLEYARANLEERGVANCLLVRSIEDPAVQSQPYDFVHSALVFQHIRPSDGYRILRQLVSRLESSGLGPSTFVAELRSASGRSHAPCVLGPACSAV
jgi:2-polyprenyl-3-methyl-5-hydroxy-6-metoxy-1,4-benzoquinol methylase